MRLHPEHLSTLLDWKRRIFELYAQVRSLEPEAGWRLWQSTRNEMFSSHPQSPLPAGMRESFEGLDYFPYDPALRVLADVSEVEPQRYEIATSGDGTYAFTRYGVASFEVGGRATKLEMYWLEGYGGGLFLPFRDATSGKSTYGACRYLYDTIKGADLGEIDGRLVLDLNFAYNPSCAYDSKWVCPLAPPPNRLDIAIEAGEKAPKK